jgi:hypothetical protein
VARGTLVKDGKRGMRGGNAAVTGGSVAGCATALAAMRGGAEKVVIPDGLQVNSTNVAWVWSCTPIVTPSLRPPDTWASRCRGRRSTAWYGKSVVRKRSWGGS